ncbi:MAG: hypothetical protein HY847_10395 [Betaproteobacteria bacterium]|nr:hypothetical protein [Betaproteobacteria bacterium]
MHNNAPDIKNYSYDFSKQEFTDDRSGRPANLDGIAFNDTVRESQREAARMGSASGRAAILIQSLVSEEGRSIGDGGILQAILDESSALANLTRFEGVALIRWGYKWGYK